MTLTTAPRVSVIVPNFNYGRFLRERLSSLFGQTFRDLEVIVIDDASTDDSREAIAEFAAEPRLRTRFFETNGGHAYRRWNDGASMAAGEYLVFAGADDTCEPTLVETLVRTLDTHPRVGLAYTRSWTIDAAGAKGALIPAHARWSESFVTSAEEELPFLLDQKTIPTASAVMIRRALFDACGGFDESFTLAADHMLWARALRAADVAYVARPLNAFRAHDDTVRARTPREVVVLERYRLMAYVFEAFDVSPDARDGVRERLARNWADAALAARGRRLDLGRAIYAAAGRIDPAIRSRLARLLIGRAADAWRRRVRDLLGLARGRRILQRYSHHYRRAQAAFRQSSVETTPAIGPRQVGVQVVAPGSGGIIRLPADFSSRVDRVAAAAAAALDDSSRCRFVPPVRSGPMTANTREIAEVARGEVITIQLLDPLPLDGLRELGEPIVDEIERRIYGSFVLVDRVYVYRSPVSRQTPMRSWLWHYDNHPREMLKVMVYLTDVDEASAPFEYLRDAATGQPVPGRPLAPTHGTSRVPIADVSRLQAAGARPERVTGPRGTVLLFDDNVIHRATLAASRHRDVLVLQLRPATFRAEPRFDPRWTGSFPHRGFNVDPADLLPHLADYKEPA